MDKDLISEVTLADIWPALKQLGCIELRVNGRTILAEGVDDIFFGQPFYEEMCSKLSEAQDQEIARWENYSFRVTHIDIKIVDFHHCIAEVTGYHDDGVDAALYADLDVDKEPDKA